MFDSQSFVSLWLTGSTISLAMLDAVKRTKAWIDSCWIPLDVVGRGIPRDVDRFLPAFFLG